MRKIRADWKTKLLQAGLTFAGAYLSAVLFNLVLQRPETAEELLQSLKSARGSADSYDQRLLRALSGPFLIIFLIILHVSNSLSCFFFRYLRSNSCSGSGRS